MTDALLPIVNSDEDNGKRPYRFHADLGGAFTPLYQRLVEVGVAGRIVEIGKIGPRGSSADFAVDDPGAFLRDLEASGHFCSDRPVGRMLHKGTVSRRELRKARGLHVAVGTDGRVRAHLDRYSPFAGTADGPSCRYSPQRVVAQVATRLSADLFRFLFGHRLDCSPLLFSLSQPELDDSACGHETTQSAPEGIAADPLPLRLPFNVIDEAVHVLDSAVEPWSVHLEVRVAGNIDETRLRAALGQALARHPMACCRKAPARPSAHSFEWGVVPQPDMDALTVVTCLDETALDAVRAELQSLCVPLAECPPFRVRLVRHRLGDIVMLNVNHAATDAFGALRFLRSIARAYAGEPDPLPDVDLTSSRDLRSLLLARDVHTRLGRVLLLLEKTGDLVTVPARVAKHGGIVRAGYGIHQVRLSLEQTQALNGLGDGARVNDVLLAALHVAIALWNIEHGVRCGRISVLMPVNLRPAHLREEMVGNFSLMVRVLTTPEQRSLGRVLPTVTDQVHRMKQHDTLAALIELLARTTSLPIWAKRVAPTVLATTGNRLVDTAQLSNLGVVDELPSFGRDAGETLELWYSPPARMPLGLSVGSVEAAERLHLAFRYRHPLLSPEGVCRFADYYLSVLNQLVAWHTPKTSPETSGNTP